MCVECCDSGWQAGVCHIDGREWLVSSELCFQGAATSAALACSSQLWVLCC